MLRDQPTEQGGSVSGDHLFRHRTYTHRINKHSAIKAYTFAMANPDRLQKDTHFRVLRALEDNPHLSQRELAEALGVSVAKANYLIKALLDKGLIKIEAFRRTGDKLNKIAYLLTPAGISNRMALTRDYLERKTREYELLKAEIEALRAQVTEQDDNAHTVGKTR